jgi:hypothetical protein
MNFHTYNSDLLQMSSIRLRPCTSNFMDQSYFHKLITPEFLEMKVCWIVIFIKSL